MDGGVDQTHPDLVNRIVPCTGDTCGGSATDSHGTHTAGIMAADGSSGVLDSNGFLRGLGVAPGANLVEQVYSGWYTQPGGMLKLITDSSNNGASVSGNSWGPSSSPQGYDNNTRQVDVGVRDADPLEAGNQPFNYVLSIMNGNGGTSSQGTPDEAKNIFTIGSTKMQNSNGTQILQINDISSNSAHGPALDGRKIPHMVAPGCNVDLTVPGGYSTMCGTSMSSPQVTGAVALFIEYYRNLFTVDPSPALVKAAFIPVAHDLAGNVDADGGTLAHPFDSKQGWGRMDLAAVLDPQVPVRYFDSPQVLDATGESWSMTFSPMDTAKPVRLMLVWTDAPGHGLGGSTAAWNNNLDLQVVYGAQTYRGNVFGASGWSQTGGSADDRNNTEGVFLGPTVSGSLTVTVNATNITSDAIPNSGDSTDQDFALVCYNCALLPDFTLEATPATQAICGQVAAPYQVTVGSVMSYSSDVTLATTGLPGTMSASFSTNPVTPAGTSTLTITNNGAAWGSYAFDLTGTSSDKNHAVPLGLDVFTTVPAAPVLTAPANGANNIATKPTFTWDAVPQAGSYSLQVASDAGFETLVIDETGLTAPTFTATTDLLTGTRYYWRVYANNPCGGSLASAAFNFSTLAAPGDCPPGTVASPLDSVDFESGNGGWLDASSGSYHWAISTVQAHSPTHSYLGTDPTSIADVRLVSPAFVLPAAAQSPITLTYWNRYAFEGSSTCYDAGILEVTEDGGLNWPQIPHRQTAHPTLQWDSFYQF